MEIKLSKRKKYLEELISKALLPKERKKCTIYYLNRQGCELDHRGESHNLSFYVDLGTDTVTGFFYKVISGRCRRYKGYDINSIGINIGPPFIQDREEEKVISYRNPFFRKIMKAIRDYYDRNKQ